MLIPHKYDADKVDEDVKDALTMVGLCQELHCLPRAGGLLDQDSRDVWLMEHVIAAQREKERLEEAKNKPMSGAKPTPSRRG